MGRFTVNEPSPPGRFSAGRFYVAPEEDEDKFQRWYAAQAKRWGLDPNPDAPEHKYDYRAAFKAGQGPDPKTGHWPSTFKADDHPNRFVGIIDTKTGQPAPAWMRAEIARARPDTANDIAVAQVLAPSPPDQPPNERGDPIVEALRSPVAEFLFAAPRNKALIRVANAARLRELHGDVPPNDGVGTVDVSAPRGAWNPLMGPPEGSSGPVRSPLGERASADIASNAFGPFVGLGERVGLVPEGTREALRDESLRLQEQAFLADPEGGVGRAVAQTGREILTGLPGPSLLLGPVAGKGGAVLARAAGAGRLGQAGAAVAAGAAEQGVENWFDTVDRPTSERLASVAIGGGLGLAGGVGDLRAAREAAGSALDSLADKVQAARRGTPPVVESLDEQRFSEFVREQGLDPYDLDAGLEVDLRKRLRAQEAAPLPPDPRPDIVPDTERGVYRVGDQEFSNIHQATIFRESLDPETGAPPPQITPERWRQLREANGRAVEPAQAAVELRSPLGPASPTREPEVGASADAGAVDEPVPVRPAGWDEGFRVPRPEDSNAPGLGAPGASGSPRGESPLRTRSGELRPVDDGSSSAPRMSTKGIENIAGMQDDLARVVTENRPEIYAARGEPVPVSRWHDAEGLQQRLRLTADDYLKWPKDRSFSTDEHALGRHYKGRMKLEVDELSGRISRGEIPEADLPAALAQKAELERNVVRMMATLQGQGSSEFGRAMRSLQEALDPHGLADTPKEKLQLALLKHYGRKNAEEAAQLEQRAVQRLAAQAKREARKAGRTATLGDLSAEFSALSSEFGKKASTPRMGLDPELVALIGKMAANRVKAGVVAVEEIADQIYMVVRNQVEGLEREDVKAAIVEHALAPKPKRQRLAPGERRIQTAESAAERSLRKLEERIAAGGAPAPKPSPVTSPKLEQLRAQRDALRQQLATMQSKAPKDPAIRKLAARERAAARVVEKLETKLAAGPQVPKVQQPLSSPQLEALKQKAAALRDQIARDPKQGLAARYRALLDEDLVERISLLPESLDAPDVLNFIRSMERPKFRDYVGALSFHFLLSGPKSLARNVIGNTVKRWDRIVMQPLATGIEAIAAPLQGRVRERYLREILPAVVGSYAGAPEGLRRALFAFRKGYQPDRLIEDLVGVGSRKYFETGRLPVDPFILAKSKGWRAFGAVTGYGPRAMLAGDAMARSRSFTSATYAWTTRKALVEGKRGPEVAARASEILQEAPDEMLEYARRAAAEDTFTDETSNIAKLIGGMRREDTGVGAGLSYLVRFLNVPDRVAAWLADYTPGARIAGAAWKGGKLRQAWGTPEASDIMARQLFGTALAAAGAAWAFQGKLVGANPKDEDLRNDRYAVGMQPWSVLIGNRWVPIRDVFGGWAAPMAAAAAFHDNARTGAPIDSEEILRRFGGAALGEARYLLDAGYLSGLADTVEAIEKEPQQAGEATVGLVGRTVAGAHLPFSGAQRNVAIFRDPRVVEKDGFLDEIKAGIPGLRETLPSRIGNLGDELAQNTGKWGGFLPVVPTENKVADPALAEEVERLRSTVAGRRTEINRVLDQIKDARKAKDGARVRELLATLPGASDRAQGDAALARVRGLEQQLRKLRADEKVSPERKRARELAMQKQMRDILSKALQRMGERSL